MQLDVALTWRDLNEQDLGRSVVAVADVLRATSVMTTAFAHGAHAIIPQESDPSARRLYTLLIEQGLPVLLCGEKDGFKREGYDLGNSPSEFMGDHVSGKTLIQLTTNGTRALVAASKAMKTLIVSFANLSAVAESLQQEDSSAERILGIVSGREGAYCMEDMVCIGGVFASLIETSDQNYQITDAARSAVDLYGVYQDRLLEMVCHSFHGQYLQSIGLESDLADCVRVDTTDLVPVMKEGRIRVE